jgi:glycosyltransferase involved in cell wall biosynthesis
MKVLFIASYFPKPDNSVMGTWALTQAQALIRQGIQLRVISFTSWVPKYLATSTGSRAYAHCPSQYIWQENVVAQYPRWLYYPIPPLKELAHVYPRPYLKIAAWSALKTLKQIIDEYQPDLFFCHHSLPNGWLMTQLPKQYQRPLLVQDHDFYEVADCQIYSQRRAMMQEVTEQAHTMLAVSKRMSRDIEQLFPCATVETCPIGVCVPSIELQSQTRPAHLSHHQIILCCALFAERKGVPILIQAFHKIANQYPDAILRIIGDGPEEALIKQMIAELQLTQQVQMVGKKSHQEVLQEMIWADCFALVGWDEPWGLVYLEAMAAGTPIICCNDGGINDIIEDGIHGYTVPPKDVEATANALTRILSNNPKRLEMGIHAQELIQQQLTWDMQAAKLVHLFEQGLSGKTSQ